MTKETSVFEDVWTGWMDFWKEGMAYVGVKHESRAKVVNKTKINARRQRLTRRNKVRLKREVIEFRRPQPKAIDTDVWDTKPRTDDTEKKEEFEKRVAPPEVYDLPDSVLETPIERKERIEKRAKKKEKKSKLRLSDLKPISKSHRQLLFVNPGEEKVKLLHLSLHGMGEPPKWALPFLSQFTADKQNVYFNGLLMGTSEEKRLAVKNMYFDPKGPSTIQPITNELRKSFANISRSNVTKILRSLEVYQLNFRRMKPPKIMGRMSLKGPGIIMCDMFFPSKNLGWKKSNCLTVMDAWSRYVRCYVLVSKKKELQIKAISTFLREFAATGHMPKYILADKGSDLRGAYDAIELYRTKPGKLVFHSKTGQPVQLVEQTQAQIQRRMQVFRTAGLTDDPSIILDDICDSINHQRRPEKGNLTPIQLLTLDKAQRERINEENARKVDDIPELRGLRPVFKGDKVRIILWTMKEQLTNSKKGFTPKWSRDIWTVKKKIRVAGNPQNFRYWMEDDSDNEGYFRHELLKIPKKTDTEILDKTDWRKSKLVMSDEEEKWK